MKRVLQNGFVNTAFICAMLFSATCWSQANKMQGLPQGSVSDAAMGACPTWYADADGDGFGSSNSVVACSQPLGYVSNSKDCNDADPTVWQMESLFVDMDFDGYYGSTAMVCFGATVPSGYSVHTLGLDCNDSDPTVFNNADVYIDNDGDHYTEGPMADVCYGNTLPAGLSTYSLGNDCDDNNALIYPGAAEIPGNHIDENCNGEEDDAVGIYFTQLKASQCDGQLDRIYNALVAVVNTPDVTQWYYEITKTSNNEKQNTSGPDYFFQLTDLPSYEFETEYAVRCGMDVSGVWQGYGPTCYVTGPSLTTGPSAIVVPQCGTTLAQRNSPIFVTGPSFVSSYQLLVYNLSTMEGQLLTRTQPWFTLKMMPGIYDYDTQYAIFVRVKTTGGYSAYSTPCYVWTPEAPSAKNASTDPALALVASPNPFDDGFTLTLPNAKVAPVQVKVYDMIGNLLEVRDVQATDLDAQRLGSNFPTGVYNVILTQDGISESIRVIKR